MIYNMLTLTMQLTVIGFAVAVIAHFVFRRGRSQMFLVELILAILGSFLGTALEAGLRQWFSLPLVYYIVFQFLVPCVSSIAIIVIYRFANNFRD